MGRGSGRSADGMMVDADGNCFGMDGERDWNIEHRTPNIEH